MCFSYLQKIGKLIDDQFSLQSAHSTFNENEFNEYKIDHSQRLLDNFFDIALIGISAAFIFRVIILSSKNAILDLILPFVIFSFISLLYYINKKTTQMKHYFHMICIPIVGLLTARKTISQNHTRFFLNESFASWLIMMMFGAFSSTQQWYKVVAINFMCFFVYITIIFRFYGVSGVGNDFYIHITTTIIFSATLIRMNEVNLRNSFNLLSTSKIQEKKWQSVLTMLTDGVLIMQHTESDKGILLVNPSLQKIFANKQAQNFKGQRNDSKMYEHTCGLNNLLDVQSLKNQLNESKVGIPDSTGITGNTNLNNSKKNNRIYNLQNGSTGGDPLLQDNLIESTSNQQQVIAEPNLNIIRNQILDQNFLNTQNTDLSQICKACQSLKTKHDNKKQLQKNQELVQKRRFNEKRVGPIFDELFRTIRFKIIFQGNQQDGAISRHTSDPQFLNDFICKQMEFFKENIPSGYSERLFLKVLNPRAIIELHMIKLDSENQVLFLFKEVSVYNKLSKARTTEKFSNILINSIAHNLFTPLNVLIQLNKNMSDLIESENQMAEQNVQMIGICLQQLVFTTHNILEMSKIRQGRFKPNSKEINVAEKLNQIFDFFKDDMKFREIEFEIKKQEVFDQFTIKLDDARFIIVLYNLVSNSVKHTNGGIIKVSLKILDQTQMTKKQEKYAQTKKQLQSKKDNEWGQGEKGQESGQQSSEESENTDSTMKDIGSTIRRNQETSEEEDEDGKLKKQKSKKNKDEIIEEKLYLSCSVTDSGVGMNYELKRKCFTLFGNLKFKKDVNQGGMGLGLASASLICKSLQGELNLVRSEENEGSKFNFIIAVQKGRELGLSSEESSENSNEDSKSNSGSGGESNKQSSSSGDNFQNQQNSDEQIENNDEEGEESASESIKSNPHDLSSLTDKKQNKSQIQSQNQSDKINKVGVSSERESYYEEEGEESYYEEEGEHEISSQILQDNQNLGKKGLLKLGLISNSSSEQQQTEEHNFQVYGDEQFFTLKNKCLINNNNFKILTDQRITEKGSLLNDLQTGSAKKETIQFEDSFEKFLNNTCSSFEIVHSLRGENKQKVRFRSKLVNLFKQYSSKKFYQTDRNKELNDIFPNKLQQNQNSYINIDHSLKNPFFNIKNQKKDQIQKRSDNLIKKTISNRNQNQDRKQLIQKQNKNSLKQNVGQPNNKQIENAETPKNRKHLLQTEKKLTSQNKRIEQFRYLKIAGSTDMKQSSDSNNSLQQEIEQINSHIHKMEYQLGTIKTVKEQFNSKRISTEQKLEESTDQDIKDLSDELNLYDGQLNVGGLTTGMMFNQNDVSLILPKDIQSRRLSLNQKQDNKNKQTSKFQNDQRQSSQFKKICDAQQSSSNSKSSGLNGQSEYKLAKQIRIISKATLSDSNCQINGSKRLSQPDKSKILNLLDNKSPKVNKETIISDQNDVINNSQNYENVFQQKSDKQNHNTIKDSNQKQYLRRNAISILQNIQEKYEASSLSQQTYEIIEKDNQTIQAFTNSPINSYGTPNINKKQYTDNIKNSHGPSMTNSSKLNNEVNLVKESVYKQKTMLVIQPETLLKKRKSKKTLESQENEKICSLNEQYPSCDQQVQSSVQEISQKKVKKQSSKSQFSKNSIKTSTKLPTKSQHSIDKSQKALLQSVSENSGSGMKKNEEQVLIVDDTVFNIKILQMILQTKYKLIADQAVSGEEALMKCKQKVQRNVEAYRFIIMDINMPGMDGVVTTKQIREFTDQYVKKRGQKEYIIVAHTAIPQDQFGNASEKGFDGFLQKPIDHDQLEKFLKKVKLI